MTTLTTILGMVPLAAGSGEGSAIWKPMGIAIIGGLTFSTVLTLIIIPIVYTIFGAAGLKGQRRKQKRLMREISGDRMRDDQI
jgi:HAE1 family hydrophobic/amphiphilic exporter-1